MEYQSTFSSFAVNDIEVAKEFYAERLALDVSDDTMGLRLNLKNGSQVFIYEKEDHVPAVFTVLNFVVDNIDETIDKLVDEGIVFEKYGNLPAKQDEKGVLRGLGAGMGPDIAWFSDPAGNIIAVLQEA